MKSRLAIITVAKGLFPFSLDLATSLNRQVDKYYQYIFIDGGVEERALNTFIDALIIKPSVIKSRDEGALDALNSILPTLDIEYFALLHSDDMVSPDFVFMANSKLRANSDIKVITFPVQTFHGVEKDCGEVLWDQPGQIYGLMDALYGPCINLIIHRDLLYDTLPYNVERYGVYADRDFQIRLAFRGYSKVTIPSPVYKFRIHPGSTTSGSSRNKISDSLLSCLHICVDHASVAKGQDGREFYTWFCFIMTRCIIIAPFATIMRMCELGRPYNVGGGLVPKIAIWVFRGILHYRILNPILIERFGYITPLLKKILGISVSR